MLCEATANVPVVNVATPGVQRPGPQRRRAVKEFSAAGRRAVPARTVTVAVNVTDCPNFEGFTDDVSAVVVAAL